MLPATQPDIPIALQPITTDLNGDNLPGPTVMAKVAGGYQLSNRLVRVVIAEKSGDVIFWGYANQPRNMALGRGIYATLTGLPDVSARGSVQMRDEQTWQFFGDDANHITWEKVYSLQGDSLFVSVKIQNNRQEELRGAVQINGELIGLTVEHHDTELFSGRGGYGTLTLQGFSESSSAGGRPVLPVLIQSDLFDLKPKARQGYTSRWTLDP
jgi:hypothetical protein